MRACDEPTQQKKYTFHVAGQQVYAALELSSSKVETPWKLFAFDRVSIWTRRPTATFRFCENFERVDGKR